ncbi:unnamed protein product [Hymenolepis diminuta]|uniref:Integrase catalytic domain-containing protein n=1 Tax=Hymenolepis diminuta TaxID=6216 RepID=A0A564YZI3_HYMDI|nr:unnamed protein product [Hymenolepis diminuta]
MFDVLKPKKFRRTEDLDQANCLSPLIENQSAKNEETVVASVSFERDVQHILAESIQNTPISAEEIRKETEKDAVPQQAAKKPIRQDPGLCPQTETLWIKSSTTDRGDKWYNDWSTWSIFSTHGLPKTLVSDNGTQFTYHPQSNGLAERFVDTFKRGLQKAKGEGTIEEVLQNFLLGYRSTPHPAIGEKSPAEMLMGRKVRTVHKRCYRRKPDRTGRERIKRTDLL